MFVTIIMVLAAIWLGTVGSIMKVTNGGFIGVLVYKIIPVLLAVALAAIVISKHV